MAGEPCLEHAYRVQLTSRTILSFSNVLVQSSGGSRPADGGGGGGGALRWIRRCSQWKTHQSGGVDALDAFSMTMKTQCGQCLS